MTRPARDTRSPRCRTARPSSRIPPPCRRPPGRIHPGHTHSGHTHSGHTHSGRGLACVPVLCAVMLALAAPPMAEAQTARFGIADAGIIGGGTNGTPAGTAGLVPAQHAETPDAFLPDPAEGWTRALDRDAIGEAERSGGTGVVAVYRGPEGQRLAVSVLVDTLDYQMYSGMFVGRGRMLHNFGVVHEVQGRNVLEFGAGDLGGDGHLVTLLPGRLCIKVEGGTLDERLELIDRIDFDALEGLGA